VLSPTAFSFQLSGFSFALLLSYYLFAVLAASLHTAWRSEWRLFPILPAVFACYHFGYGIGFIMGLVNFVVLKRRPTKAVPALTRDEGRECKRTA
jgi:hypothetical protein